MFHILELFIKWDVIIKYIIEKDNIVCVENDEKISFFARIFLHIRSLNVTLLKK